LPYHVSGTGDIATENQLVIDSLMNSGVFKIDVKQIPAAEYRTNINVNRAYSGTQSPNSGEGNFDYLWFNDYWSGRLGGTTFPDTMLDSLLVAQRREMDFERRGALVKELQLYLAQKFYVNPALHQFTTFSIRWPWVHNSNYGPSYPDVGGHLQWLDKDMPDRNRLI
jgi:ABC-type transport system substrate-binding protein